MKDKDKTKTQLAAESVILQRQEQEFRSLVENLPDIITRFDQDLRHLYVSPKIEPITGIPSEAFIGKTNRELGMPEDLVVYWDKKLRQVFETGEATVAEFAFPSPDGIRHFESRLIPESAPDGTIKTVLAITREITERKQAEATLQKQNRELALLNKATQAFISTLNLEQVLMNVLQEVRDLLEVAGGSAWLVDPETNDLMCWQATNPEHKIISGWRLRPGQGIAGWVAKHHQSVIVPDTRLDPRHFKGVDQKIGVEMRSILSVPLLGQQEVIGVLQMVDTSVDRFKASDIELVELLATTAAIAIENASLFEALLNSETRYRTLFENTPISLWEEDFSAVKKYIEELRKIGVYNFRSYFQQRPEAVRHCLSLVEVFDVNRAALELHQVEDKETLLGKLSQIILNPDPLTLFIEQLHAIAEGQLRFAGEVMLYTLAGNKIYVDLSWSVAPGSERTYQKVIVCLRDITERKRTEEMLRRYANRLSVMHEIDRAILTVQSAKAIAQVTLSHIWQLVPCQRASVVMFAFETKEIVELATDVSDHTALEPEMHFLWEDSWIGALCQGTTLIVKDILTLAQPSLTVQTLQAEGIGALIHVPLIAQEGLIGSLNLEAFHPDTFTPEQLDIVCEVADSLAVALQAARLFEAERRARQLAETLHAANLALTRTLNLDTVLETLLDYLAMLVSYDSACVMLLETDTRLTMRVSRGYKHWPEPAMSHPLTFELQTYPHLDALLSTQVSMLISDTREYSGWAYLAGREYVRSWLGVPLIAGGKIIGLYSLDKAKPGFFTKTHMYLAETLAAQAAVAIQNVQLFEQVRVGRKRLQTLSHRLVEVQEAEHRHIARELHDEIGGVLTGLKIMLEMNTRLPVEAAGDKLGAAKALVDELMKRVEELSLDLRPAMLDDLGLLSALLWHFKRYTALTQIHVTFQHADLDRRFRPEIEIAAYRIVQEALTNVARYAGVSEVSVRLWVNQDILNVQIADQGIGFDLETILSTGVSGGLTGMHERANLVGGQLVIESAPGGGVCLTAELPLRSGRENNHRDNHRSGR